MSPGPSPNAPRVAFYTLGCKVNRFETDGLAYQFQALGWEIVSFKEEADLYLINSCTVTAEAQRQSLQMVRQAVRNHPYALVGVVGCASQLFPESFSEITGLDVIGGCANKWELPPILTSLTKGQKLRFFPEKGDWPWESFFPLPGQRTRALLKIQDGCNGGCSYCLVPRARGRSRSLPALEVRRGVETLSRQGVKEVVLTGIHLGQYGADLNPKTDLFALLGDLLEGHSELRIRLSSLEPQEISPSLFDLLERYPHLCRHLHIPLQSGDDRILGKMKRNYTAAFYQSLIEDLHRRFPTLSLGTDLIVGFPGEGEESFAKTLAFVSALPLAYLHLFPFSPRPGTQAANFPDQVPQQVKKGRLQRLREVDRSKRQEFALRCMGKTFDAIGLGPASLSGKSKVLTENYLTVFVPAQVDKNERLKVHLVALEGDRIKGEMVQREEIAPLRAASFSRSL